MGRNLGAGILLLFLLPRSKQIKEAFFSFQTTPTASVLYCEDLSWRLLNVNNHKNATLDRNQLLRDKKFDFQDNFNLDSTTVI